MPVTLMSRKLNRPDPILVKEQLEALQFMYSDWGAEAFAKYMVWILSKKVDARAQKTHSRLIPFAFNAIQRDIEKRKGNKNICLKPRQVGLTTWFLLRRGFIPALLTPGTNSFLISQSGEKATEHFAMLLRAYKYIGAVSPSNPELNVLTQSLHQNLLHTAYSNRKEIIFDQLDNRIGIGSAEVEEAGQGSTLHRVICSEVARWPHNPEETLANLKEAIILDGTLDLESTANGAGGYFYQEFFRAERQESEFVAHFHPWWWEQEYRIELTDSQRDEMTADMASDEAALKAQFHLELEQVAFRREKKKSLRHNFDEKYPEDPITCFLVSGNSFFDKQIVKARSIELMGIKPYRSFAGGAAVIFHKAIPGRRYIIGADPASGKKVGSVNEDGSGGTDFSAAKVIDEDTGEEVAAYHERIAPEDFALDLEQLGRHYNGALLAVERGVGADSGGEGGTVLLTLVNQKYPNIYKHKEWWKRDRQTALQLLVQEGFPMTPRTRPVVLNKLRYIIENNPELIHDPLLLKEAMLFVRNEKGRPAAQEDSHDDMVIASAIAQGVRMIVLGYWDPLIARREKYGSTPSDEAAPEELDQN